EVSEDLLSRRFRGGEVAHIRAPGLRPDAEIFGDHLGRRRRFRIAIDQGDVGSFSRKFMGNCQSDAARAADDDCRVSVQVQVHEVFSNLAVTSAFSISAWYYRRYRTR